MLFDCPCEESQKLIDKAIAQSVALQPVADSPLAQLVQSTTTLPMQDLTQRLAQDGRQLDSQTLQEQSDNITHNGITDELVERASAIINRRVDTIKNLVIPTIKSIGQKVLDDVHGVHNDSEVATVVRYSPCDVIFIDSFMNDVSKNTPVNYLDPQAYFTQENTSIEKIVELVKASNTTINDALSVAINRIGSDNLFRMFESIFVDRAKIQISDYATFSQFVSDIDLGLDYAIVIYQLSDVLASSNKEAAKQYKEAAAYYITLYSNQIKKEYETDKVIRSRHNKKGETEVYTVTYTKFLQKGGTAEMIIGSVALKEFYFTVDDILAHSKECLQQYNIIKSAINLENKLKIRTVLTQSLERNFYNDFRNNRSEVETSVFADNPAVEPEVINQFTKQLEYINHNAIDDIYRKVAQVVCDCRFFYIDCLDFLNNIDDLCEQGIDSQDALTQATLAEIVEFVTSQIKS